MVRAILEGRKTQTRRVMKARRGDSNRPDGTPDGVCPYGVVGDTLWVRETWAPFHVGQEHDVACPVDDLEHADAARYKSDGRVWTCNKDAHRPADDGKWTYAPHRWRPSIHMPRWASRITLTITDVRVQRPQDITAEDAMAEGIRKVTKDRNLHKFCVYDAGADMSSTPWADMARQPVAAFAELFDRINGPGTWDRNPWVWALTFTVNK
jgi:hypothetical protein